MADKTDEGQPSVNSVDPSPLLNTIDSDASARSQNLPRSLLKRGTATDTTSEGENSISNGHDTSYLGELPGKISSHTGSVDIHSNYSAKKSSGKTMSKERSAKQNRKFRVFLVIGFMTTTILGIDVATNRYLQKAPLNMSGIMLITLRSAIAFVVWLPFTRQFARHVFCMKYFFWFAFLHTLNPVLNTYATKYTLAYYVQAIKLSSPFWVALACYFLKDKIPKYTIPAMLIASVGAFLTITGDAITNGSISITSSDLIGMALALSAAICFSLNFVLYTKIKGTVPSLGLTFLENFLQFIVIGSISFGLDRSDWGPGGIWVRMSSTDYGILVLAMLDSVLGSFGKIASVRVIGAPLFSTMAPWELVVTLVLSASPFLGDPVGPLNVVGVVIITITMTVYLFLKYKAKEYEGPTEVPDELGFDADLEEDDEEELRTKNISIYSPRVIATVAD